MLGQRLFLSKCYGVHAAGGTIYPEGPLYISNENGQELPQSP